MSHSNSWELKREQTCNEESKTKYSAWKMKPMAWRRCWQEWLSVMDVFLSTSWPLEVQVSPTKEPHEGGLSSGGLEHWSIGGRLGPPSTWQLAR